MCLYNAFFLFQFPGENQLGKALMKFRESIANEDKQLPTDPVHDNTKTSISNDNSYTEENAKTT